MRVSHGKKRCKDDFRANRKYFILIERGILWTAELNRLKRGTFI
jgi:hypothetical protein